MIKRPRQPLPRVPEGERLWLPDEHREPETPTLLVTMIVITAVPMVAAIFGVVYQIFELWAGGIGAR